MKKIHNFSKNLSQAILDIGAYDYQKNLTPELDKLPEELTILNLYQIVLWKLNRFPEFESTTLEMINSLKSEYTLEKAKDVMLHLVGIRGVDLPMASTILRFVRPDKFQIIDKRAFRFIMEEDIFVIPKRPEDKVALYFKYLDKVRVICNETGIDFVEADRKLYQLDKEYNKDYTLANKPRGIKRKSPNI